MYSFRIATQHWNAEDLWEPLWRTGETNGNFAHFLAALKVLRISTPSSSFERTKGQAHGRSNYAQASHRWRSTYNIQCAFLCKFEVLDYTKLSVETHRLWAEALKSRLGVSNLIQINRHSHQEAAPKSSMWKLSNTIESYSRVGCEGRSSKAVAALLKITQYVPQPCLRFLDPEVDCPRWACGSNVLHDFHVALLQLSSTEQRDLTVK